MSEAISPEVLEKLRAQYNKLANDPLGMHTPWSMLPAGGKPYLSAGRRGSIAEGRIATWDEIQFIADLVNAFPSILKALDNK